MKRYRIEIDLATEIEVDAESAEKAQALARLGWRHSFAGFPVECDFERVVVMGFEDTEDTT